MSYDSFVEHKKHFEAIPLHHRNQFLREVLKTPQLKGEPLISPTPYPNEASFNYLNYQLNYHYSESSSSPKAILVFMHGLYSYGGNSGYLATNITSAIPGVNFYSLDFINFGKSTGDCRGYIHSFDWLVQQGQAFVDFLLEKFEDRPQVFLVGQSLGGAVVFKMSIRQPEKYKGVVFLNPALREIKEQQYYSKKLGKLLGYLMPKMKFISQAFTSSTKYDTTKAQFANPYLYNGKHIPGSVRVALTAMEEIEKSYSQFSNNYILFQGGVDKSVDLFAPLDLQKESASKDKTTIYIKSMWHSTFYEEEVQDITLMVIDWLQKRI